MAVFFKKFSADERIAEHKRIHARGIKEGQSTSAHGG
jgi:hypothetical protein